MEDWEPVCEKKEKIDGFERIGNEMTTADDYENEKIERELNQEEHHCNHRLEALKWKDDDVDAWVTVKKWEVCVVYGEGTFERGRIGMVGLRDMDLNKLW